MLVKGRPCNPSQLLFQSRSNIKILPLERRDTGGDGKGKLRSKMEGAKEKYQIIAFPSPRERWKK